MSQSARHMVLFTSHKAEFETLSGDLARFGWQLHTVDVAKATAPIDMPDEADVTAVDLRNGSANPIDALDGLPRIALLDESQDELVTELAVQGIGQLAFSPFSAKEIATVADFVLALRNFNDGQGESAAHSLDPLTDLLPSERGQAILEQWVAAGDEEPVYGILLGVRRFGAVNATYGKAVGDAVLAEVARRIARLVTDELGPDALVSRIGGKSFLLAVRNPVERKRWQWIASELVETVSRPIHVGEQVVRLTATVGAGTSGRTATGQGFISRLSAAQSHASQTAGRRIQWTDRQADAIPEDGVVLENDLLKAIERDEIRIAFQPQFNVATGALEGVEALARWEHEDFGVMSAATLFAVAERTDFIEHLSIHIGRLALEQASTWPDSLASVRVSINVTAQELASRHFVKKTKSLIKESGFTADRLTLEITESALVDRLDMVSDQLKALRASGIRIAIDDFGTGYSNFLYLKSLPLDYLKLDREMTRDIEAAPRNRTIVRSIVGMALALDFDVIAEGVENEQQLAILRDEGCRLFQGFLRAGPMPSKEFVAFAAKNGF